jgi:predicted metalloprotease
MIILDPEWAKSVTAEAYLVLGHEAGHHFCGHALDSDPMARKKQELEADQFSGAAIRRFEAYHGRAFLQDALQAATRLYSASETGSHPSRNARLDAITLGYNSGSPCGDLAPGVRGYTAGPR